MVYDEVFQTGCGFPSTRCPKEEESSSREGLMATLKQGRPAGYDDGAPSKVILPPNLQGEKDHYDAHMVIEDGDRW